MEKVLKVLKEKWEKLLDESLQKAEKTNIPATEAFENGYAAAVRGILADFELLETICTGTK